MSSEPKAQGVDVSHYQGKVNWAEVKQAGMSFAYAKATEGTSSVDPQFATNWQNLEAAGLLRGAYHFFDAAVDGASQANHFLQNVQMEDGDLPPVIDVEAAAGASNATLVQEVQNWLNTVEQAIDRLPMIYTTASFWNSHLSDGFGLYPLWIAEYGVQAPKIPEGWSDWQFWQHSQSGIVSGVAGNVDMDTFNGSFQDLLAFIQMTRPRVDPGAAMSGGTGVDLSANDASDGETTDKASSVGQQTATTYTVKSGDTLDRIAVHLGVPVNELAAANEISDPNKIYVGQKLTIP